MQQQIQQLKKILETSQKILLINHIRMDWDAWGSLWGLYLVLKNMNKEIRTINDGNVPEPLDFLWHSDIVESNLNVEEFNPDIIISLDAAGLDRLGESYIKWKHIFKEKELVVIDHHISNPGFGDINIIDTESSSVCQILTHMLVEMWLSEYISPEAATFFYTGIQTDTNMYATSNTTPATLRAGAILLELWADFKLPIEKCFRQKSPEQIEAWRIAYKNTVISEDGNTSYCLIWKEDLEWTSLTLKTLSEYLKGFINETLINIAGVKIAFLLYTLDSWETKASMRCIEGYDVNAICQKFGWGGHVQAAGFQSNESLEKVKEMLLKK